jgi:ubiquinone/menaquinone biosynthesis C-methylase UbiE
MKGGRTSEAPKTVGYVLRVGEAGAQRLRLLARVKWPTTRALLRRAGLRRGVRCLDVGCGIGEVTLRMARWVGGDGEAVGVDREEAFLKQARREATRRRLRAAFRVADASDLTEESAYDLVYARFLLTHLGRPAQALEQMMRAARPGGVIVVEDIDFPGHVCHPVCPAFNRYLELYQAVVRRNGGDPAIGPRLPALLWEAGVEEVGLEVVQPTFREGEGKLVAQITMEHIREAVVEAGLASHAEVDGIVAELDAFVRNPRTIMSIARVFQVWGRKRSA